MRTKNADPLPSWALDKGAGYCNSRSRQHGKRMGHLFYCSVKIVKVDGRESNLTGCYPALEANSQPGETMRCAWCWKVAK